MLKRKKILFVLGLSFLLVGCQKTTINDGNVNTPPTPSDPDGETPENPGTTPEEPDTPDDEPSTPTFNPDDILEFSGTYFDKNQTLTIDDNGVKLGTDKSLTITNIQKEKVGGLLGLREQTVAYLKDDAGLEYRMLYSSSLMYTLELEVKEDNKYTVVNDFQPGNEALKGVFSAYGDGDDYNFNFYFGNEFDNTYGAFRLNYGSKSLSKSADSFYYKTSFFDLNGTKSFALSIYDYSDNYLYGNYVYQLMSDGSAVLYDIDNKMDGYYSDPAALKDDYFFEDGTVVNLQADVDSKTLTYKDVTYNYTYTFDGEGQVFTLTSEGHENVVIRPDIYGATFIEGDETKYAAFDTLNYFENYTFSNEDFSFAYEYDLWEDNYSLLVNGELTDYKFVIFDGRKSFAFTLNGIEYTISPEKYTVALKVTTADGTTKYLTNETLYKSQFVNSFISLTDGTLGSLSIDDTLAVKLNEKPAKGALKYEPGMNNVTLAFSIDSTNYELKTLNSTSGIFELSDGTTSTYFFEKEFIEAGYGDYTKKVDKDIKLEATTITYYGDKVNYDLVAEYDSSSFIYVIKILFTIDGVTHKLGFNTSYVLSEDMLDASGQVIDQTTYIPYEYYEDLIGTYYFNGAYGPEKFKLTNDGHFFADTLDKETGKLKEVEYAYRLTMLRNTTTGLLQAVIGFEAVENTFVLLYKVENGLLSFSSVYTREDLFNVRGVYTTSDNSTVVHMVDNVVYINGDEYSITNVEALTNGVKFDTASGGFSLSILEDGTLTLNDGTSESSLTKIDFDLSSFVGDYSSQSTSGATVKFEAVVDPMTNVTTYKLNKNGMALSYIITSYEGHVALKFTDISGTYYLYNDGTKVVYVEEAGGLLPPPPPPPPLM